MHLSLLVEVAASARSKGGVPGKLVGLWWEDVEILFQLFLFFK